VANEWLKILISALAGMLTGFIADPIRATLARDLQLYRMRRAIGFDLLGLIAAREAVKQGLTTSAQFWQHEIFPSFTFYWQRNMEYFYSDFKLCEVRFQIQTIQIIQKSVKDNMRTPADAEAKLDETVESLKLSLWGEGAGKLEMLKRKFFAKL
jgi:hypothetical protein